MLDLRKCFLVDAEGAFGISLAFRISFRVVNKSAFGVIINFADFENHY